MAEQPISTNPITAFWDSIRGKKAPVGTTSMAPGVVTGSTPGGPLMPGASAPGGGAGMPAVDPFDEAGVSGTAIWGGYVQIIERDPRLTGQMRWKTVSDMLANVSIVAASTRFFLNLVAKPNWQIEPARDVDEDTSSDAAKAVAEFVEDVLYDMASPWSRVVRRTGLYRFHGFGIAEWTAKHRDDGDIGLEDIEPRPCHTIERWQPDANGTILGVWQRSPQNGQLYWLPRPKLLYMVDDTLTDSPEGMGLFRHLIDPSDRIQRFLKLEGQGYERDLRGIPVARAPLAAINKAVRDGKMTKEDGVKAVEALKKFVKLQVKAEDTGLMLDSSVYQGITADGTTVSTKDMWGVELLTGTQNSLGELNTAIERLTADMARIIGTEQLLMGSNSRGSGGKSMSEDKSRNLYLMVNSTVGEIAEGVDRDIIGVICLMNGIPKELWPTAKTEDVSAKDVESIAAALRDMAQAGAVLAPDDPAINDLRDLMGVSRQPDRDDSWLAPELGPQGEMRAAQTEAPITPPPAQAPQLAGPKDAPPVSKSSDASQLRKWLERATTKRKR